MPASPTKQRAALAPLDANAKPSLPSPKMNIKNGRVSLIPLTGGSSPLKKSVSVSSRGANTVSGTKRSAADDSSSPSCKKTCVGEETRQRSRTASPATPSLFDTSTGDGDASWVTMPSDPELSPGRLVLDAPSLLAPRQRGSMTREQAREKAEILRLRLSLASYKLRTGQTTVPLANLQQKPLPAAQRRTVRVQSPSESNANVDPSLLANSQESVSSSPPASSDGQTQDITKSNGSIASTAELTAKEVHDCPVEPAQ